MVAQSEPILFDATGAPAAAAASRSSPATPSPSTRPCSTAAPVSPPPHPPGGGAGAELEDDTSVMHMTEEELHARLAEYENLTGRSEWREDPHYIHDTGAVGVVALPGIAGDATPPRSVTPAGSTPGSAPQPDSTPPLEPQQSTSAWQTPSATPGELHEREQEWEEVLRIENEALRKARAYQGEAFRSDIEEELRTVLGVQLTHAGVREVPRGAPQTPPQPQPAGGTTAGDQQQQQHRHSEGAEPGSIINYVSRAAREKRADLEKERRHAEGGGGGGGDSSSGSTDDEGVERRLRDIHASDPVDADAMAYAAERQRRRASRLAARRQRREVKGGGSSSSRSPSGVDPSDAESSCSSSSGESVFSSRNSKAGGGGGCVIPQHELLLIDVRLREAAPSHLSADEARRWEKAERGRIIQQRKMEMYERRLAEQKAVFKDELQRRAADRQKGGAAGFSQKNVQEYFKRQGAKEAEREAAVKAKQAQAEKERQSRLAANHSSFVRAQRNNELRKEKKPVAQVAPAAAAGHGGYSSAAAPSVVGGVAGPESPLSPMRQQREATFITAGDGCRQEKQHPQRAAYSSRPQESPEGVPKGQGGAADRPGRSPEGGEGVGGGDGVKRAAKYHDLHKEKVIRDTRREKEKEYRQMQAKHAAEEMAARRLAEEGDRAKKKRVRDGELRRQRQQAIEGMQEERRKRGELQAQLEREEKAKQERLRDAFARARRASLPQMHRPST